VAVGAQELKVLSAVVEPVAVFVVHMENECLSPPFSADRTLRGFTAIGSLGLDQRPAEPKRVLAMPPRSQHQDSMPWVFIGAEMCFAKV
jgi:hypothetical protein